MDTIGNRWDSTPSQPCENQARVPGLMVERSPEEIRIRGPWRKEILFT